MTHASLQVQDMDPSLEVFGGTNLTIKKGNAFDTEFSTRTDITMSVKSDDLNSRIYEELDPEARENENIFSLDDVKTNRDELRNVGSVREGTSMHLWTAAI